MWPKIPSCALFYDKKKQHFCIKVSPIYHVVHLDSAPTTYLARCKALLAMYVPSIEHASVSHRKQIPQILLKFFVEVFILSLEL